MRNSYRILIGKVEWMRPLQRPRNRRKDNIKIDINPLKPKPMLIIFKHSILISKKTQPITITRINWLMLFKKILAVNSRII
jgi:hypothetical protein